MGNVLSPQQIVSLARLRNHATRYEIVIIRADGVRALLCYGPRSRRRIFHALAKRRRTVLAFLGIDRATISYPRGNDAIHVSDAIVRPSGRTQRDAIIAGDGPPYVGALKP